MPNRISEPDLRLYLRKLTVLIVTGSEQESSIVKQILIGFNVERTRWRETAEAAMTHIQYEPPDLMIVDASLPTADGYDFIRDLRSAKMLPSRVAPIMLMAGHIRLADVQRARDCGASLVLVKPVTPSVLFGRIAWLARDERSFIDTKTYTGPDRRFRKLGPPPNTAGRRSDDLSLAVGEATSGNMLQSDIDAMMKPKVSMR